MSRGSRGGPYDNTAVVLKIAKLRAARWAENPSLESRYQRLSHQRGIAKMMAQPQRGASVHWVVHLPAP